MKWEYRVVETNLHYVQRDSGGQLLDNIPTGDIAAYLSEVGKQGWELVSVCRGDCFF